MGLDGVLRKGVAVAARTTRSLQLDVTLERWTGSDGRGGKTLASPIKVRAIVDRTHRTVRSATGQEVLSTVKLTILTPLAKQGASGRQEPIDPRDVITLPDGTTSPILDVRGVLDPTTRAPYATDVFLGVLENAF